MSGPRIPAVPRIRPELAHLVVAVGQVSGYPGNPRRGNLQRLRQSLTAHGQYQPLLVQAATGHVVKGNNTLAAMLELGYTHVAAVFLDIDDDRARAVALIDNWTSDESDYDQAALADLLAGVVDWDATGWSVDDLDDLLAGLDEPAPTPPPAAPSPWPATPAGYPAGATPDLDELAGSLGEPEPEDSWPIVRLKVPPHIAAAWSAHLAAHDGREVPAFAALLAQDPAAPPPAVWQP